MKIEVSHYDEKITYEMSDEIDAEKMFEVLCVVFVAIGYHPDNLDDCILSKAEEIKGYDVEKEKKCCRNN